MHHSEMGMRVEMTQPLSITELDQKLRARGQIDAQHALRLRQMVYAREKVSSGDAEILFRLDHACQQKHPSFAALYVEALTDYFVWQVEPRGHVSAAQARYLIDNVLRDGHVSSRTELELLLNMVYYATSVPDELSTLVIEAVRQQVLLSSDAAPGQNRPAFSVSAADVAILRKALHAPAGERRLLVSRAEANMLLSLNEATQAGTNDPEWTEFFCLSIANHLLNPMNDPVLPTIDVATAREKWLDERGSVATMLESGVRSLLSGNIPFADVWKELDPTGAERARAEAEALREETDRRLTRERIDAEEAAWLAGCLLRNDTLDENERALLAYLKEHAPEIDPALEPLMARAGL
jgi:hypothetical protein